MRKKTGRVMIIGTSHVSKESVRQTRRIINEKRPECVAVELCPERYYSLSHGNAVRPSLNSPMHFLLYWIQHHFGKQTGVLPGSEMLAAIRSGKSSGSKVVLIDRNISDIMRDMRSISLVQRGKMIFSLLGALLLSLVVPGKIDYSKVPEDDIVEEVMQYLKKDLPEFYRILVSERNRHMANWIKKLSRDYKSIVVVVGAGHKKGLKNILKRARIKVDTV